MFAIVILLEPRVRSLGSKQDGCNRLFPFGEWVMCASGRLGGFLKSVWGGWVGHSGTETVKSEMTSSHSHVQVFPPPSVCPLSFSNSAREMGSSEWCVCGAGGLEEEAGTVFKSQSSKINKTKTDS